MSADDPRPLDAYILWFEALPPEIARELAQRLTELMPGGSLRGSVIDDTLSGVSARIRAAAGDGRRAAGFCTCLAALTDFVFAETGSDRAWQDNEQMLELLGQAHADSGPAEPDPVGEWIEEAKLRYPLRSRQWMRQEPGWAALRAGPLRVDALREHYRALLLMERGLPPA